MRLGWITLLVLLAGCGDRAPVEKPLDPEILALIHDLVDGTDYDKRMAAHKALPAYGAVIVKPLARHLDREDVDDAVGAWIAEVLAMLGEKAEPAAPALTRRLMRGGECSATTSHALEMMGAKGVPYLVQAMASDKEKTLIWTADALSDLGDLSAPAVDALHAALADERTEVRSAAADALRAIGPPADKAVPALLPLTRDPNEEVRANAGQALAAIRGTDAQVQARLREIVLDSGEEPHLRESVLEGLGEHLGRDAADLDFLRRVAALPGEDLADLAELARDILKERAEK